MAFGAIAGIFAGGILATGLAVQKDGGNRTYYASRGWWATLGAVMGLGVGAGLIAATYQVSEDWGGGMMVAWGLFPPLGAVVADRLSAPAPVRFSIAPWHPRAGLNGAVLGMGF
jgi:hypothetical protein